MRSSKSRSRSKQNRNRSVGNIINRVFDSSGPEGKVRGTPQQIIDKYTQLARDAQLSNDRVAAENFQQHSEHYTRMLGEAMREMEAQRQGGQQGQGGYGGNDGGYGNGQQNSSGQQNGNQNRDSRPRDDRDDRGDRGERPDRDEQPQRPPQAERRDYPPRVAEEQPEIGPDAFAVDAPADDGDSGLVETPESAAPKPKTGRSRRPKPGAGSGDAPRQDNPSEAAE
jgi:Domain of unknown function (DUF4167)